MSLHISPTHLHLTITTGRNKRSSR